MRTVSKEQYIKENGIAAYNNVGGGNGVAATANIDFSVPVSNAIAGKPSFPASTGGGASDILPNIAKTFGNIPSSASNIAQQAIAPVNPLNTESPINIGANLTKSATSLADIYKNRGVLKGTKDILGGFADTYLKVGETIYGSLDKAYNALLDDPKKAITDTTTHLAKIGIEDPLLIPTLLMGGKATGASKDLISTIASPVTTSTKKLVSGITNKAAGAIENTLTGAENVGAKAVSAVMPESAGIMNRVARLKPNDFNKFTKLAGETPGEYLTRTGNFGTPDKIIAKEAEKFTNTLNAVDTEIEKLPGLYKNGAVTDALDGLVQKAKSESTANIKSPYLSEVKALAAKNASEGLTMKEINRVKRLFESKVKLGYRGVAAQINSSAVEAATNLDNALRNWQAKTAEKLGFTNLPELNKQTQISKELINKLGNQIVGQSGLNGINLTDWIMLSNGSPTAVAGFLTKKFFSSKGVQARIAEMLNKAPIEGAVVPETKITSEAINRQAVPSGNLLLPEGTGQNLNNVPIIKSAAPTIEPQAKSIGSFKTSTQEPPQLPKKSVEKPSLKSTPKTKTVKGIPKELQPLAEEARKYKSAEEFWKAKHTLPIESLNPGVKYEQWLKEPGGGMPSLSPNEPIVIIFNKEGKPLIADGVHRYFEALKRGDKTIKVQYSQSQLTDFYNKVKGKK